MVALSIVGGQYITSLTLGIKPTGDKLAGTLDVSILPNLTQLTASGVGISGIAGMQNCAELVSVKINNNGLTGSLPNISRNTKLTGFLAYNNDFVGTLPNISSCAILKTFACYSNDIRGTLPSTLSSNTGLQYFQVGSNSISGSMPVNIINSNPNIITFSANNNTLSGTVPPFGTNTSLTNFYINNNNIVGTIPSFGDGNTPNLKFYQTYNNFFTDFAGTFPPINKVLFDARNNQLNQDAVANILQAAVDCGSVSGTLSIQGSRAGTSNASVSSVLNGPSNLAILSGRKWTVTYNP